MENELIYLIGEAVMTEIENVKNVSYPSGEAPDRLFIETDDGKQYELALKAKE